MEVCVSKRNISACPFVSLGTWLVAAERKTIYLPSALMFGCEAAPFPEDILLKVFVPKE